MPILAECEKRNVCLYIVINLQHNLKSLECLNFSSCVDKFYTSVETNL